MKIRPAAGRLDQEHQRQVLDAGSFNVLEADAFAGEGVLENIHPTNAACCLYAADAAVHVKFEDEASDNP